MGLGLLCLLMRTRPLRYKGTHHRSAGGAVHPSKGAVRLQGLGLPSSLQTALPELLAKAQK